eukprot:1248783-Amorphochlora_amoeboformis.AAC.2
MTTTLCLIASIGLLAAADTRVASPRIRVFRPMRYLTGPLDPEELWWGTRPADVGYVIQGCLALQPGRRSSHGKDFSTSTASCALEQYGWLRHGQDDERPEHGQTVQGGKMMNRQKFYEMIRVCNPIENFSEYQLVSGHEQPGNPKDG